MSKPIPGRVTPVKTPTTRPKSHFAETPLGTTANPSLGSNAATGGKGSKKG